MANVDRVFSGEIDTTYRLFPDQRYELSLSDWGTYVKTPVERSSPDKGQYDVTLDDTYRYWMVFATSVQPDNWSEWELIVDIESGKITSDDLSQSAIVKINQYRK